MSLDRLPRECRRTTDPVILIRIIKLYPDGMSPVELYDVTRGVWKIGPRRETAKLALAVYQGVVKQVCHIRSWTPAGSTFSTRGPRGLAAKGRWEFVGTVAPEKIRRRYLNRSVKKHFSRNRNPIIYKNCQPGVRGGKGLN